MLILLQVKVCDGGMPPNTGSTILFVSIMDANDETPIFDPGMTLPFVIVYNIYPFLNKLL